MATSKRRKRRRKLRERRAAKTAEQRAIVRQRREAEERRQYLRENVVVGPDGKRITCGVDFKRAVMEMAKSSTTFSELLLRHPLPQFMSNRSEEDQTP